MSKNTKVLLYRSAFTNVSMRCTGWWYNRSHSAAYEAPFSPSLHRPAETDHVAGECAVDVDQASSPSSISRSVSSSIPKWWIARGRTGGGSAPLGRSFTTPSDGGSHRRGDQCYFIVTQSFREIEPGPVSLLPLTLYRHSSIFRRPDYKWDIPANRAGVFLSGGARIRL